MPRKVEILDGQHRRRHRPRRGTDPACARSTSSHDRRPRPARPSARSRHDRHRPEPRRLQLSDLTRLSTVGLRTRKLRAGLSALGIAIGVAAIVAVLGLSASSQAGLLNEINQLGTNLLTVSNGQSFTGGTAELPTTAPAHDRPDQRRAAGAEHRDGQRRQRLPHPLHPLGRHQRPDRPSRHPSTSSRSSPPPSPKATTSTRPPPRNPSPCSAPPPPSCSASTASTPANASGSAANGSTSPASSNPPCSPPPSTPPSWSATPRHEKYLGFDGHPSTIYLRAQNDRVNAVDNLLAATANPENPSEVNVSQPSAALVAQADAKSALNGLFLGLGAVALLVGAVGVANIMIISVLERRSEIGLRRALGATKGHIRTQFLSEAVLLGLLGGAVGVALGAASTAVYAHTKHWATVIPTEAWAGGIAASLIIGAVAGLIPALRAARLSPTQALWSV